MDSDARRAQRLLDRLDGDLTRAHGSAYVLEVGLAALMQLAGAEAGLAAVIASEQSGGLLYTTEGLGEDQAEAWTQALRRALEREADFAESPDFTPLAQSHGYPFSLAVPFVSAGWTMGAAILLSRQPLALTAYQRRRLGKARDKVVPALERTRMLEELQARVLEWSLLMRLGQDIVYRPDSGLLPRALSLVVSTFGYEQVAFLRDDGGVLRVDALAGKPLDGWKTGQALTRPDGLLAEGRPPSDLAWSNNLSGHPGAPQRSRAEIIVPVRLGSEVLGLLDVRSSSAGAFTQRDPSVLKSVADQLAVALQNRRLLLQAEKRAAYLEAVARIGQEVAAILRTQELLRQVAESVGRGLGYERVAIFLLDEAGATASLVAEHDHGEVRAYAPAAMAVRTDGDGPVSRAARTGQAVRREGDPGLSGFGGEGNLPTRAELCVPIQFRGRVIGILDMGTDREGVFGPDEVGALSLLANLVAAVFENARLYERERATAAELAERNLALVRAQARLIRAERLAAIGQLGLAVKHEINNPLTAILGNAEWLMEQEAGLSEEGRRALKLVHDMAIRMRDIVARLENVEDVRRPYLGTEMIDLVGPGRGEPEE
ncbi:MAG: hypothetical protein Kow00123_18230 [Anaerolineales bacterium]